MKNPHAVALGKLAHRKDRIIVKHNAQPIGRLDWKPARQEYTDWTEEQRALAAWHTMAQVALMLLVANWFAPRAALFILG